MGFTTTSGEYVLLGKPSWQSFPDLGFHPQLGGTATAQRDIEVQYNVTKNIFSSQENVRQAINKARTAAVP